VLALTPSSGAEPRPISDSASLLATKEHVLVVGGQAVNLWALYYESRTIELAPFEAQSHRLISSAR
jgi:hypothetical protein